MPFKRFVETGRVVYVVHGPYRKKLCTIVDIIDQTRVLVDGPCTAVPRHGIRINQISLTKFTIKIPRNGSTCLVTRAWKEADIDNQWRKTLWAAKLSAKKKRISLSDYDRFRLKRIIARRNRIRSVRFHVLKRNACRRSELHGMKPNPNAKFSPNWEKVEKHLNKKYAKLKERRIAQWKAIATKKREEEDKKLAKKGRTRKEVVRKSKPRPMPTKRVKKEGGKTAKPAATPSKTAKPAATPAK